MSYQNTIIYKIVCNNQNITECYVGHTTNYTKRKSTHKQRCYNGDTAKLYNFIRENGGWSEFSMIIVEKFSCNDKIEACIRERLWFEKLNSNLNTNIPHKTEEESQLITKVKKQNTYQENKEAIIKRAKEHYEKNKDKTLERVKEYAKENKDKIKDYKKDYYEANKQEIAEKSKKHYDDNKELFAERHHKWYEENKEKEKARVKEYNEQNKEKISQRQKEYWNGNKDKLKEYQKEYREANKEMISQRKKEYQEQNKETLKARNAVKYACECGGHYIHNHKQRHLQTKLHQEYINKISS